ncbi:MAG: serine hydrolase, partial [Pseudomonadota bacterium]
ASLPNPPSGLWAWSVDHPDDVLAITIEQSDGDWLGAIDSQSVMVTYEDDLISIRRIDGSRFAGRLTDDRSAIHGHWYQPSLPFHYQYVATPVVLHDAGPSRWQSEITIQSRPFRIFLDLFEDDESQMAAVVRNPEGNDILGATRFRVVAHEQGGWNLVSGSGERERRHGLKQTEGETLVLEYDRFDEPIVLEPATDALKAGYYSRYRYDRSAPVTLPPQLNDGWLVATPEEAGFDRSALRALTDELATVDPRNRRPQMVHSLLVARNGRLVYEEYFFGHSRETRHDVRSLGKVFGSVMVGALQQQGYAIDASHRPITDLLANADRAMDDPRKANITLGHLMTYTSGLDCDANSDSIGSEQRMWDQQDEENYWLYTAELPMLHEPGERYAYCSGSANLVGASLSAFGEASVHELFDRLIAQPLNFGPYHWALAPNGEGYLGGGAYMRPRDILKVGAMYALGGLWNGQQVVDEDWVRESSLPRVAISPATTGMTQEQFENNYFGGSQAYIWRVDTVAVGERRYDSYEASGNGGQLLIIVPELDLAVVFTGGNYRMGGIWGRWRNDIIGGHIIPAMTDLP